LSRQRRRSRTLKAPGSILDSRSAGRTTQAETEWKNLLRLRGLPLVDCCKEEILRVKRRAAMMDADEEHIVFRYEASPDKHG
jgi:hypothetical protein